MKRCDSFHFQMNENHNSNQETKHNCQSPCDSYQSSYEDFCWSHDFILPSETIRKETSEGGFEIYALPCSTHRFRYIVGALAKKWKLSPNTRISPYEFQTTHHLTKNMDQECLDILDTCAEIFSIYEDDPIVKTNPQALLFLQSIMNKESPCSSSDRIGGEKAAVEQYPIGVLAEAPTGVQVNIFVLDVKRLLKTLTKIPQAISDKTPRRSRSETQAQMICKVAKDICDVCGLGPFLPKPQVQAPTIFDASVVFPFSDSEKSDSKLAYHVILLGNPTIGKEKFLFLQRFRKLKKLDHPYILPMYDIVHTGFELGYIAEWIPHNLYYCLLKKQIQENVQYSWSIALQVIEALIYLHQKGITHSHLSSHTVCAFFKEGNWHIKLMDFGLNYPALSLHLPSQDPETLSKSTTFPFSPRADIYSFGCLLIELFAKKKEIAYLPPWHKQPVEKILHQKSKRAYPPELHYVPSSIASIVRACFAMERPSSENIKWMLLGAKRT
jgi:hypothetical protein